MNSTKLNSFETTSETTLGTALITGAAKRLGQEIAINLGKMGYDLVIHYHQSKAEAVELMHKISNQFSVKCDILCCDLSDISQVEQMANQLISSHPDTNLLINNASIFYRSSFLNESATDFVKNFNVHFMAPMLLSKRFAQNVINRNLKNAQIINLLDKNIARYETAYFHYLLTKKFLAELTKILALQLAPSVRVNAIAPSTFNEPVNSENAAQEVERFIKINPLKRALSVKNIIQAVDFLVNNDFLNGQIISIDGGSSLNHAG